jgi:prefoldin subunit 5
MMGYSEHLKALLSPLGIYQLEDSINGAELDSYGAQLDEISDRLEVLEREMNLCTAQDEGLSAYLKLLRNKPVAQTTQELRSALTALLRIGTGSFTLAAINDNIAGCGVEAVVKETDQKYVVEVTFPHLSANQEELERMLKIMDDIIPCHLQVNYHYWVTQWSFLTQASQTWADVMGSGISWMSLMLLQETAE